MTQNSKAPSIVIHTNFLIGILSSSPLVLPDSNIFAKKTITLVHDESIIFMFL